MKAIKLMLTFCVLAIMACSTWNSSGYENLSTLERNKVVECQDGIGNLHNDGQVYLVTTEQLQEYLDTVGRVVIYEYLFFYVAFQIFGSFFIIN